VAICKAAIKTGVYPDYVVVDGPKAAPAPHPKNLRTVSGHHFAMA
jgi:hypothetical protein